MNPMKHIGLTRLRKIFLNNHDLSRPYKTTSKIKGIEEPVLKTVQKWNTGGGNFVFRVSRDKIRMHLNRYAFFPPER